jgi:hypothetical protein
LRYFTFFILFVFTFTGVFPAFAAERRAKRDIVAERVRQYAENPHKFKSSHKPRKGKKKRPSYQEEEKEEKKPSSSSKKDSDKSSKSSSSKKDEKADEGGKKDKDAKENEKEKKKKPDSKKKKPSEKRVPRFFSGETPVKREPVFLNQEQSQVVDRLVQEGKIDEAEQYFKQNQAALHLKEVGGKERLDGEGLSKEAAATELMAYMHAKGDKHPFSIHANQETRDYLNRVLQERAPQMWVENHGDVMELSYKGHVVGKKRGLEGRSKAKDALEQMIGMRALKGRKVPVQFKVVKDEKGSPMIQAYFKESSDAASLAQYVGGEVQSDSHSSQFYVNLKDGMSKKLLPSDGKGDLFYAKMVQSLARSEDRV